MPKEKESPFDADVKRIVGELQQTVEHIPEEEVPFNSVELTEEEQLARYQEIRGDREAWRQLLSSRPLPAVLEYAQTMEEKLKEA